MAQGDTAVVRAAIGALNESFARGEPTEALLELCEADIRVDASRRMFNPEVYVGHEGMRRLIADVADAWKEFSDNVERIVEDEGKLVSIQSIRGLGRTSGVRVETRTGLLWTVREGRVSEVVAFLDHEEALRAAGVAADGIRAAGGGR